MTLTEDVFICRKSNRDQVVKASPVESKCSKSRPAVVLDMGEASREEGFRLNGCR